MTDHRESWIPLMGPFLSDGLKSQVIVFDSDIFHLLVHCPNAPSIAWLAWE